MADDEKRTAPLSELDYNWRMIEGKWGGDDVSSEVKKSTTSVSYIYDEKGDILVDPKTNTPFIREKVLWESLGIFTSDMKLGNLEDKQFNNELAYCRYMANLSSKCFQGGYKRAFVAAMSQVAAVITTSQSKNGFQWKRLSTLTQENVNKDITSPKKSLFGGSKTRND